MYWVHLTPKRLAGTRWPTSCRAIDAATTPTHETSTPSEVHQADLLHGLRCTARRRVDTSSRARSPGPGVRGEHSGQASALPVAAVVVADHRARRCRRCRGTRSGRRGRRRRTPRSTRCTRQDTSPPSSADPARQPDGGERRRRRAARRSSPPAGRVAAAGAAPGTRSGQPRPRAIGSRMSGGEHWAMVEPSVNSTMEWTTDCGWTHDVDPVEGDAEEQVRLDDLQALVDQRRGVRRDEGAHGPGRVRERLLGRDVGELGAGAGRGTGPPLAVRTSRSTSPGAPGPQALRDRRVLGVDRHDLARRRPPASTSGPPMISDSLFASASRLPAAQRGQRRLEPGGAAHPVEDDVRAASRRPRWPRPGPRATRTPCRRRRPAVRRGRRPRRPGRRRRRRRTPSRGGLLREQVRAAALGGQRDRRGTGRGCGRRRRRPGCRWSRWSRAGRRRACIRDCHGRRIYVGRRPGRTGAARPRDGEPTRPAGDSDAASSRGRRAGGMRARSPSPLLAAWPRLVPGRAPPPPPLARLRRDSRRALRRRRGRRRVRPGAPAAGRPRAVRAYWTRAPDGGGPPRRWTCPSPPASGFARPATLDSYLRRLAPGRAALVGAGHRGRVDRRRRRSPAPPGRSSSACGPDDYVCSGSAVASPDRLDRAHRGPLRRGPRDRVPPRDELGLRARLPRRPRPLWALRRDRSGDDVRLGHGGGLRRRRRLRRRRAQRGRPVRLGDAVGGQRIGFGAARGDGPPTPSGIRRRPLDRASGSRTAAGRVAPGHHAGAVDGPGAGCTMTPGSSGGPWFADFDPADRRRHAHVADELLVQRRAGCPVGPLPRRRGAGPLRRGRLDPGHSDPLAHPADHQGNLDRLIGLA